MQKDVSLANVFFQAFLTTYQEKYHFTYFKYKHHLTPFVLSSSLSPCYCAEQLQKLQTKENKQINNKQYHKYLPHI